MTQRERAAYLGGLKGGYGPRDMNRVREALEYIDRLMTDAKREGVYVPTVVQHGEFDSAAWRRWRDTVWVASDYPTPELWAAHLGNIHRLWAAARRFRAVVLARYDPEGTGYLPPEAAVSAGALCRVLDSVGLLELRIEADCPPSVTAGGTAWVVSESDTGWTARLDYPNGPYPDIGNALSALRIRCVTDAAVVDGRFTLSATLRYDCDVTAGICAVRWSPFMTWGEAGAEYGSWGGARPRTWDGAARGGAV